MPKSKQIHQQIVEKLGLMKGKTWLYNTRSHIIVKWTIDDSQEIVTVISNNKGWWQWGFEKALKELNGFLPVGEAAGITTSETKTADDFPELLPDDEEETLPATQQQEKALSTVTHINGRMNGVLDTLFDNIDKVKQDPKYIPQAQAICKTVNAVVQVVRADLDVARYTNSVDRRKKRS